MFRAFGVLTVLGLATTSLSGQNPAVKRAAETIVAADLMRDVSYLASDALLGRATPSPGFDSAAAYIVRTLKATGIKPLGDSGGYFLHYTVTRATLDTAATAATWAGSALRWNDDYRVTSFLTPSVRDGAVVYVGDGVRAVKRGLDPYAGFDFKGKWLLVHARSGPARALTTDTMGILGRDYTTAQDEAKSRGALGIITIPRTGVAGAPGAAGAAGGRGRGGAPTGRDLTPTMGRAYAPYPLPQLTVTGPGLDRLLAGSGVSAAQLIAADSTHRYPKSFVLAQGSALRVDLVAATSVVHPYVVMGLVEGSDPRLRNEWVVLATHLDGAVGRGATLGGDSIFNAADDNASGSAGNLSIARALMQAPRAKRSILLIWDSGEETGLWGARFLAYGPLAERMVALVNMDMIGRSKAPGTNVAGEEGLSEPGEIYLSGPRVLSTQLDSIVERVGRNYPFIVIDRKGEDPNAESFYPRTDAAPYIENGIPYIGIRGGLHADYHRQGDEVAKLDLAKMAGTSRIVMAMLWETANDPVRPRMDKPMPPQLWFVKPRR